MTSKVFGIVVDNLRRSKSEVSSDSAVFVDDFVPSEEDGSNSRILSRSNSSISSVCSCVQCCGQQREWRRRPSRLVEGHDVEDFYRFDAVLGKIISRKMT